MSMRKILSAAALAPVLMLTACGGATYGGLEPAHQPVVSRADYLFDVATSGNALAPGERQRLAGWMHSINVGYGDRIAVDDPSASGGAGVRDEVQTQAARYGLLLSEDVPVSGAPVTPGTVRIVVSRMKATVPHCPDFSRDGGTDFAAATSTNHGCAVNSSLAAMMANPTDLVRGQPGSDVADLNKAGRAIDAYRNGGGVSVNPGSAATTSGSATGGAAIGGAGGGIGGSTSGGD